MCRDFGPRALAATPLKLQRSSFVVVALALTLLAPATGTPAQGLLDLLTAGRRDNNGRFTFDDTSCLARATGVTAPVLRRIDRGTSAEFKEMYPLTDKLIDEAIVWGDSMKMRRFLDKLRPNKVTDLAASVGPSVAREPVVLAAIGGSFTGGTGCADEESRKNFDCAWASRLGRWIETAFPGVQVEVVDLTWNAVSSAVFLGGIAVLMKELEREPDVILIDTLVNDAAMEWGYGVNMQQGQKQFDAHGVPYEALIRAISELLPNSQLVSVLAGCPDCLSSFAPFSAVAQHYSIPVVNYAKIVAKHNKLGDPAGPDRLWPLYFGGGPPQNYDYKAEFGKQWIDFAPVALKQDYFYYPENHVPYPVHQYLADILSGLFLGMLEARARNSSSHDEHCKHALWDRRHHRTPTAQLPPLFPVSQLNRYPACVNPAATYSSKLAISGSQRSLLPIVRSGNWRLFEDRKGKPGWIATQSGSKLSMTVEFGWFPTLAVSFLKSYEGMRAADVSIRELRNTEGLSGQVLGESVLNPLTHDRHAQTAVRFFTHADTLLEKVWDRQEQIRVSIPSHEMPQHRNRTFRYEVVLTLARPPPDGAEGKFKLVNVVSC